MGVPPDYLVTPAQLPRYGVPSAFLAQFLPRPFEVLITTGGALGTMAFAWRFVGDEAYSSPIASGAGSSWVYGIDDAFASLTFAAGSYTVDAVYTVDVAGTVSPATLITADVYDLRDTACSSVTTEAMYLMRDAIRPPLTSWGDDARTHAGAMVYAILKRSRGATPEGAGAGDANIFLAEEMGRKFFREIGENGRPDSMTDTSTSSDGPLIPVYPVGDSLRGW
jgi:hypothetical protein